MVADFRSSQFEAARRACTDWERRMKRLQAGAQAARREEDDDAFWYERESILARERFQAACVQFWFAVAPCIQGNIRSFE